MLPAVPQHPAIPLVSPYLTRRAARHQAVIPNEAEMEKRLLEFEARDPEAYANARRASDENNRQLQEVRVVL